MIAKFVERRRVIVRGKEWAAVLSYAPRHISRVKARITDLSTPFFCRSRQRSFRSSTPLLARLTSSLIQRLARELSGMVRAVEKAVLRISPMNWLSWEWVRLA